MNQVRVLLPKDTTNESGQISLLNDTTNELGQAFTSQGYN